MTSSDQPPTKRARTEQTAPTLPPAAPSSAIVAAMKQLERDGYAVIESVVSPDKCAEYRAALDTYMLGCGVDMHDPQLKMASYPNKHGIVQHMEIGHCDAVWGVRQEAAVADVFAWMYGTNELLVSFDGACIMPPHHRDSGNRWWHVDQSHQQPGRRCIQGYVNLTTSHDKCSGSLMVIPGSHLLHERFGRDNETDGKDWYKFDDNELSQLGDSAPVRVYGGVGSLVLWDSRTAHQGCAPSKQLSEPARARYVVYVCYQPRSLISWRNLLKKQAAFDNYRMTTHWPASKFKLFSYTWQTYGKDVPPAQSKPPRDRKETPRMLELAGKTQLTTQPLRKTKPLVQFQQ